MPILTLTVTLAEGELLFGEVLEVQRRILILSSFLLLLGLEVTVTRLFLLVLVDVDQSME